MITSLGQLTSSQVEVVEVVEVVELVEVVEETIHANIEQQV